MYTWGWTTQATLSAVQKFSTMTPLNHNFRSCNSYVCQASCLKHDKPHFHIMMLLCTRGGTSMDIHHGIPAAWNSVFKDKLHVLPCWSTISQLALLSAPVSNHRFIISSREHKRNMENKHPGEHWRSIGFMCSKTTQSHHNAVGLSDLKLKIL